MKKDRHYCFRGRVSRILGHRSHHIYAIGHSQEHFVHHRRGCHRAHHLRCNLCLFRSAIGPGADTGLAQIVHGSPRQITENIRIVLRDLPQWKCLGRIRLGSQHDSFWQLLMVRCIGLNQVVVVTGDVEL